MKEPLFCESVSQNRGGRVTRKKHKKKKEYPQHWWVGGGTMAQAVAAQIERG